METVADSSTGSRANRRLSASTPIDARPAELIWILGTARDVPPASRLSQPLGVGLCSRVWNTCYRNLARRRGANVMQPAPPRARRRRTSPQPLRAPAREEHAAAVPQPGLGCGACRRSGLFSCGRAGDVLATGGRATRLGIRAQRCGRGSSTAILSPVSPRSIRSRSCDQFRCICAQRQVRRAVLRIKPAALMTMSIPASSFCRRLICAPQISGSLP
jgi:hypothetical protein